MTGTPTPLEILFDLIHSPNAESDDSAVTLTLMHEIFDAYRLCRAAGLGAEAVAMMDQRGFRVQRIKGG